VDRGFEITFDKERVVAFLRALAKGEPVGPPSGREWTAGDLLTLAGSCLAMVLVHSSRLNRGTLPTRPLERAEAASDELRRLMEFAVQHQAGLAAYLVTGLYDESYEPVYRAFLTMNGEEPVAPPLSGWKGEGD
jgi:hypothetical protein